MRVAFDLDGVLADFHKAFASTALRLFPALDRSAVTAPNTGSSPPETTEPPGDPDLEDPALKLPLTARQTDAVWRELGRVENFWESLDEIEPGAIARIEELALSQRWELIFVTSRPIVPGRTVQRQSQAWLQRYGFPAPSVYVINGSRGRLADALALDVLVDDRPDNCLDVVLESPARAILVWRGPQAKVPASAKRLGIGVVPTVAACLDMLVEASRASATPVDFRERLRRLLGLRTKPAAASEG